ncbi:MAG: restriction endonuclease, partial [Methyloceanibacter sp.]
VVGRSGDEGVDILADLYSPLITAKVAVQVKRHTANIGPRDISYLRDRWSRRADRLLFVTTADFTLGAKEVAADEHDKQVEPDPVSRTPRLWRCYRPERSPGWLPGTRPSSAGVPSSWLGGVRSRSRSSPPTSASQTRACTPG